MRISVSVGGEVMVTTPRWVRERAVERFVAQNREWIERHTARARTRVVVRVPRRDVLALKQKALALAESRCAYFAKIYGLSYRKISIRAQKSRWGSCSAKGNLSFNYKIAALPTHIADYIIVHEVCHLGVMNHSKKFWDIVSETVPDHVDIRRQLRQMHVLIR